MSERVDAARRAVRKVIRDARDKNKWRKIVRFRLWMPVALQILLVAALLWYTNARFPGFVNATNVSQILILALPLIVAAMAQTHALLVGYLDLSVGGMIGLGVVVASFLIGAEASIPQIVIGVGVILLCGVALGLVNAGLIRGLKIPSIIATLATLSILDGISLTMRPTAQGVISPDLVSVLTTSIGPIPVAFIVIVVGAGLADLWLHASGSGLELRAVGFDERSAKRGGVRTSWIRVRALLLAAVLAAVASFFVMARSPIGNATIGSTFALNSITAAVLGGASLAGGRATFLGSTVAAILLALIITVLPYLGLSPDDGPMIIGILVLIGIVLFQLGDIKELAKRNYKRARRLVVGSRPPKVADLPAFYPSGTDFRVAPAGRTLIRGGTVLSLDPHIGDLTRGDVLVEGDRIVAVGPALSNGEVEVIDATDMIVMPGFVDSHRHIWEGLLRNIGTDVPLEGRTSYISFVLHKLAPAFRPEDAYIGNLVSALGAIDAGITTLLDWSHIQGSPAHTDAVIQALNDSGLRAVFAYGFPWWGKWEERQPSWFVRAATEHFSTKDQKLTLALAAPGPEFTDFEVTRDHWKLARETGARITTHVGVGSYGQDRKVQEFGEGVTHLAVQRARVGKDAALKTLGVAFGASLARAEVEALLAEDGGSSEMLGVYFGDAEQHIDHRSIQDHVGSRTSSDLLYKGAMRDRSNAIYTGTVIIEKGAHSCNAYQTNRNILLSEHARAQSVPNLEILSNDPTRCGHAASVGPVSDDELFYLMSRGIPEKEAQRLIVFGFFAEVLDRVDIAEIREGLEQAIENEIARGDR